MEIPRRRQGPMDRKARTVEPISCLVAMVGWGLGQQTCLSLRDLVHYGLLALSIVFSLFLIGTVVGLDRLKVGGSNKRRLSYDFTLTGVLLSLCTDDRE